MKIILKENIENLGSKGDIVKVASGYGRNYLLPKKLALEVTATNMKMIEIEQASLKKNLEKARVSFQDVIQSLNDVSLSFERKAGEKDTIFGSVSVADIKEALDKMNFEIEKKKILLKEPIKRLGNFTVPIKVFLDDIAEIKIQVLPEGGVEEDVKLDVEKEKEEKKIEKAKEETVPKEVIAEVAPDEHEEPPKEESVAAESKEAVKPKEEKGEVSATKVAIEEKPEGETPEEKELENPVAQEEKEVVEAGSNEEAPKDEEKDKANEKIKTSK
ncbi:50S ribosomal protein L9 [Acidobacteriota bacterium]